MAADDFDDYDNWTWEQIETAICGGVDMSADDQSAVSKSVSDPDSFRDASERFDRTVKSLNTAHDNLKTFSDRIIGVEGAWQGAGAESFRTMMQTMLGMVDSVIDTLSNPSYATTLLDAETDLRTAINEVHAADSEAAHAALDRISMIPLLGNVFRDEGGTRIVAVALFPDIVETMTGKMRASIKKLATAYGKHGENMRDPGAITFPNPSGEGPTLAATGQDASTSKVGTKAPIKFDKKPVLINFTGDLDGPNLTNLETVGLDGQLHLPTDALVTGGLPPGALTTNLVSADVPKLDRLQLDHPDLDPITHLSGTNNLLNGHTPALTLQDLTTPNLTTPNLESQLTVPGSESLTTPNLSLLAQTQQPPGTGTVSASGLLGMLARASRPFRDVRSGFLRDTPPVVKTTNLLRTTSLETTNLAGTPQFLTSPVTTRGSNFITEKSLVSDLVLRSHTPEDTPTVPGMIGRRGPQQDEDEWTTSLVEDEDLWTAGTESNPSFLNNSG